MKTIRWGILGCGRIARKFAADLARVEDARLVAVAARKQEDAKQFASEFGVDTAHDGYEALVKNADVDVIYIATPHPLHLEHTLLCLNHNKAVLCEKPLAMNLNEVQKMVQTARQRNVFLMEAFWTRFLPHYEIARTMIMEGKVGKLRYLHAEFGFKPEPPVPPRLFDPELGGGALLDIGVYPVFLALDLLGKPDRITAVMTQAGTGVDEQTAIRFDYKNGTVAHLFCTFSSNLASGADVAGTTGRIRFTERFHGPTAQLEYYPGKIDSMQKIETPMVEGFGYQFEAQHVTDCLLAGLTESPVLTYDFSLLQAETVDQIRKAAGIVYPGLD